METGGLGSGPEDLHGVWVKMRIKSTFYFIVCDLEKWIIFDKVYVYSYIFYLTDAVFIEVFCVSSVCFKVLALQEDT